MLAKLSSLVPSPVLRERMVRVGLLLVFAWLAGRYWHPYTGFTYFLQADTGMVERFVPALRDAPLHVHRQSASYDGGYYVQIAADPALDAPALEAALDDPGYRARRILLPAVAWLLGGGGAAGAAHAYAALNVALWFALAAVLWRIFPVGVSRATVAWASVLFGAGVLFSVRFALSDLPALLLAAAAGLAVERNRHALAAGFLGLAGLTRETAVLGLALLWHDGREAWKRPLRTAGLLALALVPLAAWLLYVRSTLGASSAGVRNLAWPLAGWLGRWQELAAGMASTGNPLLVLEGALEHVALTVQASYLVLRPRRECPWWRLGVATLALMLVLGPAVWGGFPNAASRVLLPLTLVFNIRAVRDGACWGWLLLGNLSLLAGVHALAQPAGSPHHLPMPSTWSSRHLLETDSRWMVAEWNSKHRWAWCDGDGGLTVSVWPARTPVRVELQVRGITPRDVQVVHAGQVVWSGPVGDRPQWITLPALPTVRGRLELELRSTAPPVQEGSANTARRLSFACFGARLTE